jgi:hypothetical protein
LIVILAFLALALLALFGCLFSGSCLIVMMIGVLAVVATHDMCPLAVAVPA